LQAEPNVSSNFSSLNLLKLSAEGFRTQELVAISGACRNLEELFAVYVFDPRYMDCVGNEALVTLAKKIVPGSEFFIWSMLLHFEPSEVIRMTASPERMPRLPAKVWNACSGVYLF